jgi:hypothetical protein
MYEEYPCDPGRPYPGRRKEMMRRVPLLVLLVGARGLRRRRGGEVRRTRRPEGRRQAVVRRSREGGEAYFRLRRLLHPRTAVRIRGFDAGRKRHARQHPLPFQGKLPRTDLSIPYNEIGRSLDELPKDKDAKSRSTAAAAE